MYSFIILTTGGDDYTSGTARITGLKENRSNRTDLIIPATVTDADGKVYTVTEIGDSAFTGNPWVTSIIVEEGIKILGTKTFSGCDRLEKVVLPTSLRILGSQDFFNCPKITTLELPEGLETIRSNYLYGMGNYSGPFKIPSTVKTINTSNVSGPGITEFVVANGSTTFKAVNKCLLSYNGDRLLKIPGSNWTDSTGKVVTTYTTPSTVKTIDPMAFTQNYSLTVLTLSEGVESAEESISTMPYLQTVNIPSTLKNNPFSQYTSLNSLTTINVATSSPYFASSEDGVMFKKDATTNNPYHTLAKYPSGARSAYTVPKDTKVLGFGCFCRAIMQSLTLNEGLVEIERYALRGILYANTETGLGTLTIPSSVTKMHEEALFGATFTKFAVASGNTIFTTNADGTLLYQKLDGNKYHVVARTEYTNGPLKSVVLDSNVVSIGRSFGYMAYTLQNVDLSKTSVQELPPYFWHDSVSASTDVEMTLTLPNTLTTIRYDSISNPHIKKLTIPANVSVIENDALSLPNVTELTFLNTGTFSEVGIFGSINRNCVIKGRKGSSAENIAKRYVLKFQAI